MNCVGIEPFTIELKYSQNKPTNHQPSKPVSHFTLRV